MPGHLVGAGDPVVKERLAVTLNILTSFALSMDGLDVRIIRTMGVFPFGRAPRPARLLRAPGIADELGVPRQRIHARIKAMERAGVIAGYQITPNHRHLGVDSVCYYYAFPTDEEADTAMEKAAPLEGVAGCYGFVGGGLCVNLTYKDPIDMERKLAILVGLAGEGTRLTKFYDLDMPDVHRPLSNLDWRIIQTLRGNALRPLSEAGTELGISARTVKRRFERMADEGSFFITPQINPAKAHGLMFYLGIHLDPDAPPDTLQRLREVLDDHLVADVFATRLEIGAYNAFLFASSMAEVGELSNQVASTRGITGVVRWLFRNAAEGRGWMGDAIAAKVEDATA